MQTRRQQVVGALLQRAREAGIFEKLAQAPIPVSGTRSNRVPTVATSSLASAAAPAVPDWQQAVQNNLREMVQNARARAAEAGPALVAGRSAQQRAQEQAREQQIARSMNLQRVANFQQRHPWLFKLRAGGVGALTSGVMSGAAQAAGDVAGVGGSFIAAGPRLFGQRASQAYDKGLDSTVGYFRDHAAGPKYEYGLYRELADQQSGRKAVVAPAIRTGAEWATRGIIDAGAARVAAPAVRSFATSTGRAATVAQNAGAAGNGLFAADQAAKGNYAGAVAYGLGGLAGTSAGLRLVNGVAPSLTAATAAGSALIPGPAQAKAVVSAVRSAPATRAAPALAVATPGAVTTATRR